MQVSSKLVRSVCTFVQACLLLAYVQMHFCIGFVASHVYITQCAFCICFKFVCTFLFAFTNTIMHYVGIHGFCIVLYFLFIHSVCMIHVWFNTGVMTTLFCAILSTNCVCVAFTCISIKSFVQLCTTCSLLSLCLHMALHNSASVARLIFVATVFLCWHTHVCFIGSRWWVTCECWTNL